MTTLLLQQLLLYMLLLALLLPTATYEQLSESVSGSHHLHKKRAHYSLSAAKKVEKAVEQRKSGERALDHRVTNYRQPLDDRNAKRSTKRAREFNVAREREHFSTESASPWQWKTAKEIKNVSSVDQSTQKSKRHKRQPIATLNVAQRQVSSASAHDLHNLENHLNLPVVPMPAPPPFPSSQFGISAFGVASPNQQSKFSNSYGASSSTASQHPSCGGLLKQRHGIIQTPNFPHKFNVPIECVWIIDASELSATSTSTAFSSSANAASSNVSIVVYLTQLYVLGGLKFTEYMYYSDDYKVPAHRVFQLTEDDVTQVASVQFNSQYLEVRFSMSSLDGTHLRALDRLLDVYGFNITYEVHQEAKPYQCNTLQCRFLGHCFAKHDFSSYYCACYPGFSGTDCGRGPLCEDPHTNVCQNGGTCKHIGDAAITCHCPAGFKGTKCEIPEINEITMGCTLNTTSSDCHQECNFDHPYTNVFNSARVGRTLARSGKTRYEVTIRLGANLTAFYRATDSTDRRPGDHLPSLLERHLSRVLRNFNITKISDLELLSNSTDRLDITFHFFGVKGDSLRIREAITRMVERGRIGNITLVSNFHLFDENPPLNLMDMTVNQNSAIREDSEFIISCTAQGSSKMLFQWFKDGALVNASKATREIWTTVLPPETKDIYTAILGVTKANRMDEGIYTCKVIDWGIEQCRSLHIHIKSPPRLRVDPASVTLHRGESLRVRCLSPGNDDIKRYAQLGYSWTRNGQLFQSDPATVMWEDLYPDGSILKINNIQKSAEYACIVSNTVKPVLKSVYITVIDRNAVKLCHTESSYAVRWPTSAPGAAIISDCPKGYEGYSKRICEKRDVGNSSWLQPDFSLCIADQLLEIYNKFRALKSGFQKSNSSAILKSCFEYTIRRHKRFLPGEAGFLIDMLHEVDSYLQLKGTQLEREMAAEIILHILDKVMQNAQSLNSQQQIKKLQLLTQSAALNRETIAASQLATSTSTASVSAAAAAAAASSSSSSSAAVATSSSAAVNILIASAADTSTALTSSSSSTSTAAIGGSKHQNAATSGDNSNGSAAAASSGGVLTVDEDSLSLDRLNSLRIYMTSVKTLPFNLRIYGDDLFSDQLYMDIGLSSRLLNIMANTTIFASVISYKNLKSFLPKTYYTRGSDTKDTDYVLASRIIQTWLFQSNRSNDNFREPLDLPFEAGHVEIIFQHENAPKDSDWLPVCGHDYKASFESTWRSELCITKNLMENMTRCICPLSGTYVVMLTKRNFNSTLIRPAQRPIFVIISCGCCLLQSCTAFAILLPIWYNRKCAVTFLKMQFCVSTSSVMVIFLLGFLKMLPVNMQAIISSSLASLLLFGISTLIAIALVIHSELVPKKFCHMTTNATTAALVKSNQQQKQQHQQQHQHQHQQLQQITDLKKRRSSNSAHLSVSNAVAKTTNPPSGIRGAIGISWLLPLLFAISSPLICSIIGKWPRNWWLEVMTAATTTTSSLATTSTSASSSTTYNEGATTLTKDLFSTSLGTGMGAGMGMGPSDSFFNGYNLLESSNNGTVAALTNVTTTTATATTTKGTVIAVKTSATIPLFSPQPPLPSASPPLPSATFDQLAGSSSMLSSAFASAYSAKTTTTSSSTITTSSHEAATAAATPSLSFVIFIIIDILFILLFVALLLTLIKKLLWLLRKNQNPHPHPLGKYNMAIDRRLGLLYRSAVLLLIKLTTDALFIVYVNSTEDSWWSYPFGLSSILLGFTILCCFVIKAESNLRSPASGGCASTGTLKTKLSSSKTSLDENYCTGSINSPLSFYTSHEKEKDNECGVPTPLTSILTHQSTTHALPPSSVQLPLTIISTAPRCQMIAAGIHDQGIGGSNVETFLGGGSLDRKSCLQQQQQQQQQHQHYQQQQIKEHERGVAGLLSTVTTTVSSPAARCCNILGGGSGGGGGGSSNNNSSNSNTVCSNAVANSINIKRCLGGDGILSDNSSWQTQVGAGGGGGGVGPISGIVFYDAYAAGMTGSLGRRQQQQQQQQHLYQQQQLHVEGQHEFVGVETLDILQGVSPDSIIGIRTSSMLTTQHLQQQYHQQQQQLPQHHKPFVELQTSVMPPTIVSIGNPTTATNYISNINNSGSGNTITTNSVTTQTPKAQKRVTIVEPTTHTFDPMLPTMAATATIATHHIVPMLATPTPIITITSSSIDETTAATATATVSDTGAAAADNETKAVTPDDENSITGMFDRITHDLDYLLNRTNEVPPPPTRLTASSEQNAVVEDVDCIPPPPLPPTGTIPQDASTAMATTGSCSSASSSNRGHVQHDVIIEESELE